jgi:hypothetical protein
MDRYEIQYLRELGMIKLLNSMGGGVPPVNSIFLKKGGQNDQSKNYSRIC